MGSDSRLSDLEHLVLRMIPEAKDIENLAKLTKAAPQILGRTIAKLQIEGYIGANGQLTEKGKAAIADS